MGLGPWAQMGPSLRCRNPDKKHQILQKTPPEKPLKTDDEHRDDQDAHRRGALGRRPVGASRYRVKNAKLETWHRYAGVLMFLSLAFMITGIFTTIGTIRDAMDVKAPTEWAADACVDQGWYESEHPITGAPV